MMNTNDNKFSNEASALAEAHLFEGRTLRLTIPTTSMLPALKPGDQITVGGMGIDKLRVGDIVLQVAGNIWIAHRIIEQRYVNGKVFLLTKGDNLNTVDEPWAATYLRGIVLAVQRGDRRIDLRTDWAKNVNLLLALLSRGTYLADRISFRWVRGLVCQLLRLLMRVVATLLR